MISDRPASLSAPQPLHAAVVRTTGVTLGLAGYLALYLGVYPVIGPAAGIMASVPTIAAGWRWGSWAGLGVGLLLGAGNGLVKFVVTGVHDMASPARSLAILVLAAVGWIIGWLRDTRVELQRRLVEKQQLAQELARAHDELEQRVEERTLELADANKALRAEVRDRRDAQDAQARLVEERLALEQQLFKAQKMEAIGRLAGGVAHDFNNLLTAIIGFSELAGMQSGEPQRQAIEQIRKAADRASELTRALLAFARQEPVPAPILDVNEVVSGAQELLKRLIGEDVELSLTLSAETLPVKIAGAQLERVIVNLAVNARDAMPSGGVLQVSTENVARDGISYVRIRVSDTGIGMDETTRARLFEPFFTTKAAGHGTGLGLATSYGVITQAGGQIRVTSKPAVGTTFEIDLPRADRSAESLALRPSVSGRVPRGRETVLVVEDEPLVRAIMELTLLELGYQVLTAGTPERALELARVHREIELVVTDVILPGSHGEELVRALSCCIADAAVLYVSGYTRETLETRGSLTEDVAFLSKPFTPHSLAEKVRAVLDARAGAIGRAGGSPLSRDRC